jgi:hypothetical protein
VDLKLKEALRPRTHEELLAMPEDMRVLYSDQVQAFLRRVHDETAAMGLDGFQIALSHGMAYRVQNGGRGRGHRVMELIAYAVMDWIKGHMMSGTKGSA